MARFGSETVIERPPAAVFWYVVDLENMARWLPGAAVRQVSGVASEAGAAYVQRMPEGDGEAVYQLTVEEVAPLERFAYRSVGEGVHGVDLLVEYAFAESEEGTQVWVAFVTGTSWLGRLLSPLAFGARIAGNREAGRVLARLKLALESAD